MRRRNEVAKMFGSDDPGFALDKFTVMKILSHIEGDDSKLKAKSGNDLLPALLNLYVHKKKYIYHKVQNGLS